MALREYGGGAMKAIVTKFHGPGNIRGARISATDGDTRISIPYDYSGHDSSHDQAAIALCKKLNWTGTLVRGGTKTGNVYVWLADGELLEVRS